MRRILSKNLQLQLHHRHPWLGLVLCQWITTINVVTWRVGTPTAPVVNKLASSDLSVTSPQQVAKLSPTSWRRRQQVRGEVIRGSYWQVVSCRVMKRANASSWALTTSFSSVIRRLQPSARCCDVDLRFDHCHPVRYAGRWCRWDVEQTTLAVESPTDLFVASHWLELPSCRFPVTLLVYDRIRSSRTDHSTSQVLTTFHVVFITTFTEGLFQKAPMSTRPSLIGSTAVMSHAAVNSDWCT